MPFHKYSPRTAKSLFKSTPPSASQSQPTPSRSANTQGSDGKTTPTTVSLNDRLNHTRALIAGIKKERYKSDLKRSRMDFKEAAKARIEAAQRAALDEELRNEALEELKRQQLPSVTQRLEEELRPKVKESLLAELRAELQPKVHAELRTELVEELTEKVWAELQEQLRDEVEENLRLELEETLSDSVREKLYHQLYPDVVAQLKDDYRDMVLLQLKEEVAAEELAKEAVVNGGFEAVLDPALMAESEASDIGQAPSELAVLAKRRFSEGFEDEDPETRTKKLKIVNQDEGLDGASESLLMPTLHSFKDSGIGRTNESLDEGEKADAEDEPSNHLIDEPTDQTPEQAVTRATREPTPEDANADGGDELSDEDIGPNEQPNEQDGDAIMETEADGMGVMCATPRPGSSQDAQVVKYPRIPTPDSYPEHQDIATDIPQVESFDNTYVVSQSNKIATNGTISDGTQADNSLSSSHEKDNAASRSSSPKIWSWPHVAVTKHKSFSTKTLPENPDSISKAVPRLDPATNHSTPSNQESEHEEESDNEDQDAIHEESDANSDEAVSEEFNEEDDDREPVDEDISEDEEEIEPIDQSDDAEEEAEEDEDEMEEEEQDDESNASDAPSDSHLDPMRLHAQYASLPSFSSYSQGGHQDDPIALDSD